MTDDYTLNQVVVLHNGDGPRYEGITSGTDRSRIRAAAVARVKEVYGDDVVIEKVTINGRDQAP